MTERSHLQWTQPSVPASGFLPGKLALRSFSRRYGSLSGPLRPWRRFESPVFRQRFKSPAFRRRFQSPAFRRRFQSPAFLSLAFRRRFQSPAFQLPAFRCRFRSPVFQTPMSQSPVYRIQSPMSSPSSPCEVQYSPGSPCLFAWSRFPGSTFLSSGPPPRSPPLGRLVVR
ncbi:hypothetical protein EYF80_046412 [Liparis tanakae]|uniref:Uncharacterized protein n=1 Tax=Liparis tanakae TaxID=230148 RepID=A0A4Z2FQH7_9TELE|nr:hypothetical protein EYF80_046412 [Liparis tanakae]